MSADEARIVMMDLYEREFGIFHHGGQDANPLSSVLMHEEEEVWVDSPLRDLLEDFAVFDMGSLWNVSLIEYLNLPMPYTQLMQKIKEDVMKKKSEMISSVGRKMGL
jgi:hypothetical protein